MKYFKMIYNGNEASDKKHIACQEILNNNIPEYSVCVGKPVNCWNSDITFVCENNEETTVPDWLSNPLGWFAVSSRFVTEIRHLENDSIQYLPIKVKACQPQMIAEEYSVANIITVLDAVDIENSKHMLLFGKPNIIKYALKGEIINSHHIFKVKESILSLSTFVSEDFKEAIQKADLRGFSFTEIKVV